MPIENIVKLLENNGIIIIKFDFGTDLLDGFWIPIEAKYSLICIALNPAPAFSADRQRFTLCHELGHSLLHRDEFPGKEAEQEANKFAGEFLLPQMLVSDDLTPPISFSHLKELKAKWKMMIPITKRKKLIVSAERRTSPRSIPKAARHKGSGKSFRQESPKIDWARYTSWVKLNHKCKIPLKKCIGTASCRSKRMWIDVFLMAKSSVTGWILGKDKFLCNFAILLEICIRRDILNCSEKEAAL